ncbi:unnamed protein product [Callosobruchus maculatus]|uniref:Uncharacterized protein n=1 Tax=Callosobruchus maculatus TaxID=64391 RepID=A0A653DP75_CALMS|nr:unnamed protein product [Callosobruchus maculatus]
MVTINFNVILDLTNNSCAYAMGEFKGVGETTEFYYILKCHLILTTTLAWLLSLFLPTSFAIDAKCDYQQDVLVGHKYRIDNKDYPHTYKPGTICRWIASSKSGTKLTLECDMDLPTSQNCQGDKLLISLSGDPQLEDARSYCGKGTYSIVADSNRLAVGLLSHSNSHGGKFACSLTAVSTKQASNNCDCGWKKGERIVGGKETGVNEFPSMVGIVDMSAKFVYCGGTIISNKYVLTAASCLSHQKVENLEVVVGEHDVSTGRDTPATATYRVDSYEIHPQFHSSHLGYDIGILRTKSTIKFNLNVGPACLPFRLKDLDFRGQKVTMLGWGTLGFGGPKSNILQKVDVLVTPNSQCPLHKKDILPALICTYSPGKDACQSDSGGPLLWMDPVKARLYLVGIISYGHGCASKQPSVNTRVTSYLSWIVSKTSDATYCTK